jgi:type VI secretion system secreted protein VgrG
VHHATQSYESDGGESSYSNSFHCIPHEVPYRTPQLTEKPNIGGAQTATVVGASGEEIDVDEYGRIVVQFHWDRLGEKDENSSCRVRVSQSWAGKGWGAIFHPRIGQEVIVEFLEGDPDRPIVTGRVYNGEQTVPYTLPADKTKSGIKSRSTKEGQQDNFNEIRFDDKKGSELVSIQAEKDLERLVKNDETDKVQNNRTRDVGANEVIRIGENLTVDVGKDKAVTVAENHSETIGSDQSLSVSGDRTRSVGGSETVDVGSDQSITIGGSLSQDVGDEMSVNVGSKLTLEAADQITLKTGSAKIIMKKNGDITIQGKKINIKGSGDVKIKGSKVASN